MRIIMLIATNVLTSIYDSPRIICSYSQFLLFLLSSLLTIAHVVHVENLTIIIALKCMESLVPSHSQVHVVIINIYYR